MRIIISLLLSTGLLAVPHTATGDESPTVLVIGDSITARYNADPYSTNYGWWARTAYAKGLTPVTDAVNNSGMQVLADCAVPGTRFIDRVPNVGELRPDTIWVEGGRNDMYRCRDSRHRVVNDRSIAYEGIYQYMIALANEVDSVGIARSDVHVLTPWGTTDSAWGTIITGYVKYEAERVGFDFVPTTRFTLAQAPDGVHPNGMGNRALSNQLIAALP